MSQSLLIALPLAGISLVGLLLLSRKRRSGTKKFGAFVEEFELLPPPPPPPPSAPPLLTGLTFAVKDIFDIVGKVTGFGNPDWARTHEPASQSAPVVQSLIKAGATCVGKTHMDELAYSINGENKHYGTPVNPAATQHVPGGSSSGSAVAVASGLVDFSIGTDTGGSIRVPAAFCGVLGFRPSHGDVSVKGVIPMAPSFDTVGCFARTASVLRSVSHVLLQQPFSPPRAPKKVYIADDLFDLSSAPKKPVLDAFMNSTEKLLGGGMHRISLGTYLSSRLPSLSFFLQPANQSIGGKAKATLAAIRDAFRACQGYEFTLSHGEWIATAKPKLGADIAARVKFALSCTAEQAVAAYRLRDEMRAAMNELLKDDALMVLPTAAGLPPRLKTKADALDEFRQNSFSILAIAGMSGCPQVSIPAGTHEGLPLALSLMARYGADGFLLDATLAYEPQISEEAILIEEASKNMAVTAALTPAQLSAEKAKEKGNSLYKEKKFEAAVDAYSDAISLDGRNATYYSNRAMAHLQLCNFAEAEEDCSAAIEIDTRNVKAMLRRGTAREFLGLYAQALEDFEHALVYEPKNKTAIEAVERMKSAQLL